MRAMARYPQPGTIPATADNIVKAQAVLWLMCATCDREAKAALAAIIQMRIRRSAETRDS
jgi:hypothetical protein